MFFQGPARSACELAPETSAEAAIFDLDGLGGMQLWLKFREKFHAPAVVLSVSEKQLHNAVWVRKPINLKELTAALDLIRQRLHTERRLQDLARTAEVSPPPSKPLQAAAPAAAPVVERRIISRPGPQTPPTQQPPTSTKAEATPDSISRAASLAWSEQQIHEFCGVIDDGLYLDPSRHQELFYKSEGYLQGLLQQACRQAQTQHTAVRLEAIGNSMTLLPDTDQVYSEIREPVLRALCIRPLPEGQGHLKPLGAAELSRVTPAAAHHLHTYENILWVVTLLCARGRVPAGTDLDAPVVLHSWPNFPRILIPPYAMQIAALWMTRPTSLMQTAKLLRVPHRYVFALYSGCHALELLELAPVVNKPEANLKLVPAPAPMTAEKRSLLGNLLRKLRLTA